jgi:hypothetical protein
MSESPLSIALRLQAGACRHFGSPLYADLLSAAHASLGDGGPVDRLLSSWEGDPLRGFLPLRLMGAVHERVLAGEAPELARFYPSVGGDPGRPGAWRAFEASVESHAEALRPVLENFPQTNEVRRSAPLLTGFLVLAQRFGLPLRLLEIGASAGLNLHFDRYRYDLGPHRWGNPRSSVHLCTEWHGPPPPLGANLRVTGRAGCDIAPIDVLDPARVRSLESYIWPDQPERLAQLRAAIEVFRAKPARLEPARAVEWLARELRGEDPGVLRVVFHSSMWIYLSPDEQAGIVSVLEESGARSPLAWLRHEDERGDAQMELLLRTWPGADDERLARGHPHGREVHWELGSPR